MARYIFQGKIGGWDLGHGRWAYCACVLLHDRFAGLARFMVTSTVWWLWRPDMHHLRHINYLSKRVQACLMTCAINSQVCSINGQLQPLARSWWMRVSNLLAISGFKGPLWQWNDGHTDSTLWHRIWQIAIRHEVLCSSIVGGAGGKSFLKRNQRFGKELYNISLMCCNSVLLTCRTCSGDGRKSSWPNLRTGRHESCFAWTVPTACYAYQWIEPQ